MHKGYKKIVLNTSHTVDLMSGRMRSLFDNETVKNNQLFECSIIPFKPPKTFKQIAAIHVLFDQMSITKENQYAGNTPEFWKSYYKLRSWYRILKSTAYEEQNQELIDILERSAEAWHSADPKNKNTIEHLITNSKEFSFKTAKKGQLMQFIDELLADAATKGIHLRLERSDYEG